MTTSERLKKYWADVRAGLVPAPVRKRGGELRRTVAARLDGSFGPDRGKRIVVTLHPDGRLELRPERTRRGEVIALVDAYRWAVQCRVNAGTRAKREARKAKHAERLAAQRQARAEQRLTRPL